MKKLFYTIIITGLILQYEFSVFLVFVGGNLIVIPLYIYMTRMVFKTFDSWIEEYKKSPRQLEFDFEGGE